MPLNEIPIASGPSRRRGSYAALANARGQAIVEAGMVILLLVVLSIGLIELGRAWMVANMITHAASDAARAAAISPGRDGSQMTCAPSCINSSQISTIKNKFASDIQAFVDPSAFVLNLRQPKPGGIPLVEVSVLGIVPYIFNLPFLGSSFRVVRIITYRDEGA